MTIDDFNPEELIPALRQRISHANIEPVIDVDALIEEVRTGAADAQFKLARILIPDLEKLDELPDYQDQLSEEEFWALDEAIKWFRLAAD